MGEHLQRARRNDYWDTFSLSLENKQEDPALKDQELAQKLRTNREIGEKKLSQVFQDYVKKQEEMKNSLLEDKADAENDDDDEDNNIESKDEDEHSEDDEDDEDENDIAEDEDKNDIVEDEDEGDEDEASINRSKQNKNKDKHNILENETNLRNDLTNTCEFKDKDVLIRNIKEVRYEEPSSAIKSSILNNNDTKGEIEGLYILFKNN